MTDHLPGAVKRMLQEQRINAPHQRQGLLALAPGRVIERGAPGARPGSSTGPSRQKIPLHRQLADLRVQLADLALMVPPPALTPVREHLAQTSNRLRRCCMNTRCGWGGVARTSRDPPQEPRYGDEVEGSSQIYDEVSRGELGGLQSGPRSTRRCDGVAVLGSDRCLDAPPERPAGWAAAVLGSRHRDRPDPAAPLPSPAAPSRRVPARSVRDDAPQPRRPRSIRRSPGAVSI